MELSLNTIVKEVAKRSNIDISEADRIIFATVSDPNSLCYDDVTILAEIAFERPYLVLIQHWQEKGINTIESFGNLKYVEFEYSESLKKL